MKAMIFSAGLGTRLKPITDHMPKALITVGEKALLEHVILKLKAAGFDEIVVNVHHFPDLIIQFLKDNNNFGIHIEISDEREHLLDTGGGIKKAASFFDDGKPFLVHNVDILSNIDLKELYRYHTRSNPLATLVVNERNTSRYLLFDNGCNLKGWVNLQTGETKPQGIQNIENYRKLAFAGIQILSPEIFKLMEKYPGKFPIMDFYLGNTQEQKIKAYIPSDFCMMDVGKIEVLKKANEFLVNNY